MKLGIQNSQKIQVLRLPVEFLKYGNSWYLTAFFLILPATFSELFYELYGTNTDDDKLIVSVCCSNRSFFWLMIAVRHGQDTLTNLNFCGLRHHKNKGDSAFLIPEWPSSSGKKMFQWCCMLCLPLKTAAPFQGCFLERHYWMLCCYELSIELSISGDEIPCLADFLLSWKCKVLRSYVEHHNLSSIPETVVTFPSTQW